MVKMFCCWPASYSRYFSRVSHLEAMPGSPLLNMGIPAKVGKAMDGIISWSRAKQNNVRVTITSISSEDDVNVCHERWNGRGCKSDSNTHHQMRLLQSPEV
jgi:hypothetical protein